MWNFLSSSVMLALLKRLYLSALCKDILIPEDIYFLKWLTKKQNDFLGKPLSQPYDLARRYSLILVYQKS